MESIPKFKNKISWVKIELSECGENLLIETDHNEVEICEKSEKLALKLYAQLNTNLKR